MGVCTRLLSEDIVLFSKKSNDAWNTSDKAVYISVRGHNRKVEEYSFSAKKIYYVSYIICPGRLEIVDKKTTTIGELKTQPIKLSIVFD